MSLFTVSEDKCIKDGICAAVCPANLIDFNDKNNVPVPIPHADIFCINCGHCVSACSTCALTHKNLKPEDCIPIINELSINAEQAEQFIRSRRSIRRYKEKNIDKETLTKLIDITRHASSGHNSQPVKWLVVQDKNDVRTLSGITIDWMRYMLKEKPDMAKGMHMDLVVEKWEKGMDNITRDAPHLIIAYGEKENSFLPAASNIALACLELTAPSMGLGACWAGYFYASAIHYPPMKDALKLPEGNSVSGAVMVGYPKYKYHRIPTRKIANVIWR